MKKASAKPDPAPAGQELARASQFGLPNEVEAALRRGADPNAPDELGRRPLWLAACGHGVSPLASHEGFDAARERCVRRLVQAGARVEA